MAKVIFVGGERDSVEQIAGTIGEISGAGLFDATYARLALQCNGTANAFQHSFIDESNAAVNVTGTQTFWFHCEFRVGTTTGTANGIEIRDSANGPFLALRGSGTSGQIRIVHNSNTGASPTWVNNLAVTIGADTRVPIDIKITLGTPHTWELYTNNSLSDSGSFTNANFANISRVWYNAFVGNAACNFSQLLCTEGISTVNAKVFSARASAAGTTAGWTGGVFGDVNELVLSDTTFMQSIAANQVYTHAFSDITLPSGYAINTVFVWTRAKNDGTAPNNLQHAVRRAAVDYFTGNLPGIGTGFAQIGSQWKTDPSTAAAWTATNFNAAEIGGKSIT